MAQAPFPQQAQGKGKEPRKWEQRICRMAGTADGVEKRIILEQG